MERKSKMPFKPKRPCSYPMCPRLTDGRYCKEHEKIINKQYEKYQRDPMTSKRYGKSWRVIRKKYVASHPFCELCLKEQRFVPVEVVHHILPVREGGTHNINNLMSLCNSCHSRLHSKIGDRWKNK